MSALTDAERFLWLLGIETEEDPVELLRALVVYAKTYSPNFTMQAASNHVKLQVRIAELETELRESKKKAAAHIELLEVQLDQDHQHKRIQDLETRLKEAKAQTAAFRRAVVSGSQAGSQNKKP